MIHIDDCSDLVVKGPKYFISYWVKTDGVWDKVVKEIDYTETVIVPDGVYYPQIEGIKNGS